MREKILFDKDWFFHEGDLKQSDPPYKGVMYIGAKTERYHYGPACKDYIPVPDNYDINREHKTERWETVDLPHDYLVGQRPDRKNNNALGFAEYRNAWYIKRFSLPAEDADKRVTLLFEGVATHATVYLNGCLLKHNFCGYTTFEVDITDMMKPGEINALAVYVNTEEHEGWWYEGGGIYRHVWLCKTVKVAVDLWGIFAKPVKEKSGWTVPTEMTVRNDNNVPADFDVTAEILDADGHVLTIEKTSGHAADYEKCKCNVTFSVKIPKLWSPETPYLYTMRVTVSRGGEPVDTDRVRFGFRTVTMSADTGLFVNGKPYKIKGVCGHADAGLFGKAVPDNIQRYKVEMLKDMGANGYRTSHYPQSEALMDALDENGFLVMDETRWFESTEEGIAQLEALIRRDRNRPSVVFWSVGNEEMHFVTEEGRRVCRKLMAVVRKLDDSRPVMTAVDRPVGATVYDENVVLGVNYHLDSYDMLHEKYPDKPIFASECCATGTTRGWYFPSDPQRGYVSAWDRMPADTTFSSREYTWKYISSRPYIMGGYQWMGIEYRGETVWPRLCSQSGAIDLYFQKKDAFYQNLSLWSDKPMVHLLPHWNFRGLEGEVFPVWVYTNQPQLELFLNGKSLGRRTIEPCGHGEWQVAYEPGTLTVRAYDKNGRETASETHETTGAPVRLGLIQDTKHLTANGRDMAVVTCVAYDAEGREVPDAEVHVSFTTIGDARIYSTGSDISDHRTLFSSDRRMRAGRIGVAVKLGHATEGVKVVATAPGLSSAVLTLHIENEKGEVKDE